MCAFSYLKQYICSHKGLTLTHYTYLSRVKSERPIF